MGREQRNATLFHDQLLIRSFFPASPCKKLFTDRRYHFHKKLRIDRQQTSGQNIDRKPCSFGQQPPDQDEKDKVETGKDHERIGTKSRKHGL